MSSIHPKTEARRRPVSVVALKLWELAEELDQRLDEPASVLETLVNAAAKGEQTAEIWARLHAAAVQFEKTEELARAYEQLTSDRRIKLLSAEQQAFIYLQAAQFLAISLADTAGAIAYAERAVAALPGPTPAFELLESLLRSSGNLGRLAEHYAEAAQREPANERRLVLLYGALALTRDNEAASDFVVHVGQQILALAPNADDVRDEVMRRLLVAGRHADVVDLLEHSLKREPPPAPEEAQLHREQLVDLCFSVLGNPERALTHIEGLLAQQPNHPMARRSAEELLGNAQLMLRAAAALSDAFERTGELERAADLLGFELSHVRGPRRVEVQRRLGILRQDALGDLPGALELLGPVVAGDPGDDALRGRFVTLSLALGQTEPAARLLSRALGAHRDAAVRARVGVDVGNVYRATGDSKRARSTYQKVLEAGADTQATLAAAHQLAEMHAAGNEPAALGEVLELVVRLEPEEALRHEAAQRLWQLSDGGEAPHPERTLLALRALVGSPWSEAALDRLEALYGEANDDLGLSDVLAFRAERAGDPLLARELGARALELRTQNLADDAAAIDAFQSFSKQFGASREVHARLIPLLEKNARYAELADVLLAEIDLAGAEEQSRLWFELGQLRVSRLGNAPAALDAFAWAVALDADHEPSRLALEELLATGEARLGAAAILDPLYRRGQNTPGLLRVLEARTAAEPEFSARLGAAEEAARLAEEVLHDAERALDIAGRALADAIAHSPDRISFWFERVERLGAATTAASGPRRMPAERLALYETVLAQEAQPERRRELLAAMARLQQAELGDATGAIGTLRRLVAEAPLDVAAHDALVHALSRAEDDAGLVQELGRMLPQLDGERRSLALLRLAEAAERTGDGATALIRYRELLDHAELSDDVLSNIEKLALSRDDGPTLCTVLERRLSAATDAKHRAQLLERLGNAWSWQLGDAVRAAKFWQEGAELSEASSDPERAARLYARVLEADANNLLAAGRLLELQAHAQDWAAVTDAFNVLLGGADADRLVSALSGLESAALAAKDQSAFLALIDRALARSLAADRSETLELLKARVLALRPGGQEAAAALFRSVLSRAEGDTARVTAAFAAFLERAERTPARLADLRSLYAFRVDRSEDPGPLLLDWARLEDRELADPRAAAALYARAIEARPEHEEAYLDLARLQGRQGDTGAALQILQALRLRAEGIRPVDLAIAELLADSLGRPAEALALVRPLLEADPSSRDALRVVHRALAAPETRAEAARLLERAAEAAEDPVRRADVIEALLAVSAEAPELAEMRNRWLSQLLATKTDDPEAALAIAIRGAEAAPRELELWTVAEQSARRLERPKPVADAYARVFARGVAPALADELGRRMVEFYEEWFDDPEAVIGLLERVVELCPTASWAFDRLKLAFNAAGRWQDLFKLYDARLTAVIESAERIALLREAAMAARDFAGDPERAMAYLEALHEQTPDDTRVEASLERLYERHARKRPLIRLLTHRLRAIQSGERPDLEARIAALWLDLDESEPALELSLGLFDSPGHEERAVELLSRLITLPSARAIREGSEATELPLLRATGRLKLHYRASGSVADVVRMLELEEQAAASVEIRRGLLEQIVQLRLTELRDEPGAFETIAELVLLDPENAAYRKQLGELGRRIGTDQRRAEVLVTAARSHAEAPVRTALLNEAASVYRHALGDEARAIELYRDVLREVGVPAGVELTAARELSTLLRPAGEALERTNVLERLAELEDDGTARRAALGEAAELAFEQLGDAPRAIAAYRLRIRDDAADLEAMNGLCRALESSERWDELIAALQARANVEAEPQAKLDRVRVAELHAHVRGDRPTAIEAWESLIALHGRDRRSFEALSALLSAEARWQPLAALFASEIELSDEVERRRALLLELGSLHEQHTGNALAAVDAYVEGGDWGSARRVATERRGSAETGRQVCECLLALATAAWSDEAEPASGDSDAARTADWALGELCTRLLEAELYDDAVRRMLDGATLPLARARRRELVREAACLCSDRLDDAERAIDLFQTLLDEDGADEAARGSVTRLAALLEDKGRFDVIATLWENQAIAQALAGNVSEAQALWARAGELAETRLADVDRALGAYERGAELGGEACLEALARVHGDAGKTDLVARALERLCAVSSSETLASRALRLAEAYLQLNRRGRAREALEQALPRVLDGAALRQKLAVLYRDAEDFAALAALTEEEANRASDPRQRLALLRQAAELHLERRNDPIPAVALLERSIEIEPDDSALRLRLSQALYAAQRFDDAATVLRDQLGRYGSRRPKDRALVHYQLARVLLASDDRTAALAELDAAARIDPAHPKILHMLARTALDEGELDRAERMYRALLLVASKPEEKDAPSRSEALIALADIAAKRGDEVRADEFIASAFENAQASPGDAESLEAALRARGRADHVARALDLRLSLALPPKQAARCLCELAELHDQVLGDIARVREPLLRRAHAIEAEVGERELTDDETWSALGRVYVALGDPASEARVIERRVEASTRTSRPPPSPDLLYRLAEVRLRAAGSQDQGLDLLERALELAPDYPRAEALLHSTFERGAEPSRALELLERGARVRGDSAALLAVSRRRIALGQGGMQAVREAVELAAELGQDDLGEEILRSALDRAAFDGVAEDAAWVRLELARRRRRHTDVPAALALEEDAAHFLDGEHAPKLLLSVARESLRFGDAERAARLLADLRNQDPTNRDVFEPLLELYRSTNQPARLVELLELTAPIVESADERTRMRLEHAEVLIQPLGRKQEAIQLLREVLHDDPDQRAARSRLFELLDAEGREDELVELLDSEIEALRERGEAEAASGLAVRLVALLERHGRAADALDACRAALAHDPERAPLLDAELRLAENSGDEALLAEALERRLQRERGPATRDIVRRLLELRDNAADASGIERALELGFAANPADMEVTERLAALYRELGDNTRVTEIYERALREVPNDRGLITRLIAAYRAAGRQERGLALLDRLRPSSGLSATIYRTRAELLAELGRHTEAVAELERACELEPRLRPELIAALENAAVRADPEQQTALGLKLVDVLESAGDAAGARSRLVELVRAAPSDATAIARLATLEASSGNSEAALVAHRRWIELLPNGSELVKAVLGFSEIAERLGRPVEARSALERALEIDRENAVLRARLGAALEADGAYRALAELLREEALRETRRDERAKKLLRVGELLLLPDGDLGEALEVLEKVRAELPDSIEAVVMLSRAYGYASRVDDALRLLDGALELHRGKRVRALAALYEQKADFHLEEGMLADALAALVKASEMDPKNSRLGMRAARQALEAGEEDIAQRMLRAVAIMKTADVDGPDGARSETKAEANYALALLAQKAGDPRKARVLAAKALSENPEHPNARTLLRSLDGR